MGDIFLVNYYCTSEKDSGNSAAVVTDFTGVDAERLALAKELGKPVTVFISDVTANEPVLKYFYPDAQMPLCLHGSLAAAKILFTTRGKQQLNLFTDEGRLLCVSISDEGYLQIKVSSQECEKKEINKEIICQMLHLPDANVFTDHLPLCVSSVGSPKLLVPLKTLKLLSELQPNYELIKNWSIENNINGLYVYTEETYLNTSDFHARGFNPKAGHKEDAATGVAAAALSLVLKKNIKIEQGYFLGKPCYLVVSYLNSDTILVGGEVSTVRRLPGY